MWPATSISYRVTNPHMKPFMLGYRRDKVGTINKPIISPLRLLRRSTKLDLIPQLAT